MFMIVRSYTLRPLRGLKSVTNLLWISCQLGAREHYAVPRALHRSGYLDRLITDIWLYPNSLLAAVKRNLRDRFHPELKSAIVQSINLGALAFEAKCRLRGLVWVETNLRAKRMVSKTRDCRTDATSEERK